VRLNYKLAIIKNRSPPSPSLEIPSSRLIYVYSTTYLLIIILIMITFDSFSHGFSY